MKLIQEYIEWIMILGAVAALLWYMLGTHVIQYYAIVSVNKMIVGAAYLIPIALATAMGWVIWKMFAKGPMAMQKHSIKILYID